MTRLVDVLFGISFGEPANISVSRSFNGHVGPPYHHCSSLLVKQKGGPIRQG